MVEAPLDRPEPSWRSLRVEQPLSTNTIKELRFVPAGAEYMKKDRSGSGTGGGYYMGVAPEAGYYVRLADTVVFVTEKQLDEAKATSFASRHPVVDPFEIPDIDLDAANNSCSHQFRDRDGRCLQCDDRLVAASPL